MPSSIAPNLKHIDARPTSPGGQGVKVLIMVWLTLYGAALHFFDNVVFFHEYPEPTWLTPERVGALFLPIALYAHVITHRIYLGHVARALRMLHAFVFAHLISLGHYLFAPPSEVSSRINSLIALQVGLAVLLLITVIGVQRTHYRNSLGSSLRLWMQMIAAFVLIVLVLEHFWPSKFDLWWMP